MKSRWLFLVGGVAACVQVGALLGACASDENPSDEGPAPDAGALAPDGSLDAGDSGTDGAPCTDCEHFPAVCTPDVLCPNGPFDSTSAASNLDARTEIYVLRGRGPNDVWAAGSVGGIAHFDGVSWTRSEVGAQETQRALWLRESGEVSIGSLTKIHTRGLELDRDAGVSAGGWSARPAPTAPPTLRPTATDLRSSWSSPGSDTLWMAALTQGGSGLWRLRHTPPTFAFVEGIPPSVCQSISCAQMIGIHGASAGTLWAVGEFGAAIRIGGAGGATPVAKPFNSLTSVALRGVWAAADSDVWAVGAGGTIRHYRGDPLFWEVVADVPTKETLNAVWGTSATDVWAVGDASVVLHYDGSSWSRVKLAGLGALRPNLYAVWSPGPGHIWIGGQGIVASLGGKP